MNKLFYTIILLCPFWMPGQHAADPAVLHYWTEEYRLYISNQKTPPPVAARVFAYWSVAIWESTYPFTPGASSLRGQLNGWTYKPTKTEFQATQTNPEAIANRVSAVLAVYFFPADSATIRTCENIYVEKFRRRGMSTAVLDASAAFGTRMAREIIQWASKDGYDGLWYPPDYQPPQGLGKWQPLPLQTALLPYFGNLRTFIPQSAEKSQPTPPFEYSDNPRSDYYQQAMRVWLVSEDNKKKPEQKDIAHFWADNPGVGGTPPGHSMSIVSQVLKNEKADWGTCTEAYARCGIALADAFISCWKTKYKHNLERPITAIRRLFKSDWKPLLMTPPFPEWTSGHSVQMGAVAEVLTHMFDDNKTFTDYTHQHRTDIDGSPRTYISFKTMSDEAAMSRYYGGIHYYAACTLGLEQGQKIGEMVVKLNFRKP
jgi:hypothetical protein